MNDIFRSMIWVDPAEEHQAAANITNVHRDRLLALTAAEQRILTYILDFHAQYKTAPGVQSLQAFAVQESPELEKLLLTIELGAFYRGADFQALLADEIKLQFGKQVISVAADSAKMVTKGGKTPGEALGHLFASVQEPRKDGGSLPADMRDAASALTLELDRRKTSPGQAGIPSGYKVIDDASGGLKKKQLYLHAGYPGMLKSTMIMNQMVNAAELGWNMLLFTTEMPAIDVMLRLICIHSAHAKFKGCHTPLNAFEVQRGNLTADERKFFEEVKDDLANNSTHGSLRVIDSGEFTTFDSIIQRTISEHRAKEVDQIWIDYLTRLPVAHKYSKIFLVEARNETIADAKRFAMSFNGGAGLVVCSAFQTNRESYKRAQEMDPSDDKHRLDLSCLAQHNAAEKEADVITYSWFGDTERATLEPKIGVLKSRWGEVPHKPVSLLMDRDSRRIFDTCAGLTPVQVAQSQTDVVI